MVHCDGQEVADGNSVSNPEQANVVLELVDRLKLSSSQSLMILSPCRAQVELMRQNQPPRPPCRVQVLSLIHI